MSMSLSGQMLLDATRPALEKGDPRALARVACTWDPRQVCQLLAHPDVDVRRVAAVVVGHVGDKRCLAALARALHDPDAQVNQMAEHALWLISFRACRPRACRPFHEGVALLEAEAYPQAIDKFKEAIGQDPEFAEAFNQCAIAQMFLGEWREAAEACREAARRMPQHAGAIAGMGHAYTQLGDHRAALGCYRRALEINPRMPAISKAIDRIEHALRQQNDSSGMYETDKLKIT